MKLAKIEQMTHGIYDGEIVGINTLKYGIELVFAINYEDKIYYPKLKVYKEENYLGLLQYLSFNRDGIKNTNIYNLNDFLLKDILGVHVPLVLKHKMPFRIKAFIERSVYDMIIM